MYKQLRIILLFVVLLVNSLIADEIELSDVEDKFGASTIKDGSKELKQSIHLGFANTTGNTETMNLNGKYKMSATTFGYNQKDLRVAFSVAAYVTENDDVRDNEEYTVNLGIEQVMSEKWFSYASVNWLRNTFKNFDNKYDVGAGTGTELFNDGKQIFKVKLGLAYNVEQYTNAQSEHTFTSLNEYLEYHNTLNEVSNLYIKLGASQNIEDFGDYELLAVAGFNFSVAKNLSLTLEQEIAYDKIPPIGFDTTDTKSIVRIGYNF